MLLTQCHSAVYLQPWKTRLLPVNLSLTFASVTLVSVKRKRAAQRQRALVWEQWQFMQLLERFEGNVVRPGKCTALSQGQFFHFMQKIEESITKYGSCAQIIAMFHWLQTTALWFFHLSRCFSKLCSSPSELLDDEDTEANSSFSRSSISPCILEVR